MQKAGQVSFWILGLMIPGGLLFLTVIGALQLTQDERLSQKSFLALMKMVLEQLPIIQRFVNIPAQSDQKNQIANRDSDD
jgi:hypothetical protein